tara:strand:+ start:1248 stop:1664 length:417 start_codon:yes stop_codon:yes gene_type:complete
VREIDLWNIHVKPALNFGTRLAWKIGTSTRAGIPDVIYRNNGEVAFIEMKNLKPPKRATTNITLGLSIEQRAHLREWGEDGKGHAFVLAAIGRTVRLFPWYVPNVIQRENLEDVTLISIPLEVCKIDLGKRIDQVLRT